MAPRRSPLLWFLPIVWLTGVALTPGIGQACDSAGDAPPKAKTKGK